MSSVFASPSVRVCANLGLFSCTGFSHVPPTTVPWNMVPQNMVPLNAPPFPLQRLDIETPPQYHQPHFLPYPITSDTGVAPVESAEAGNSQSALPQHWQHEIVDNTAGPTRRPPRSKRPKPYTRRSGSTSSSSQSSSPASEPFFPSIMQERLAVEGVCKLNACGQTFNSVDTYLEHINTVHNIKRGKHGDDLMQCPWDGCQEIKRASSVWNHVSGHNTKWACARCNNAYKGARTDTMHRHFTRCPNKVDGLIPSGNESYLFFEES